MIDFDVPKPIDTIAADDDMYEKDQTEHYFKVGNSALKSIILAMNLADKISLQSVLDMPCGYGRVLRYIKAKFPQARLTACDIQPEAVDFCVKTFDAAGVYSCKDFQHLCIKHKFDLIWCGSLLTHLNKASWGSLLNFFYAHLEEGGIVLFSSHGRLSVKWLLHGHTEYGLQKEKIPALLRKYKYTGFGYLNYPDNRDYGISIASPSWVLSEVERHFNLKILAYIEAGWDDHQDIVACVRSSNVFEEALFYPASRSTKLQILLQSVMGRIKRKIGSS
jgi:SAM-dependent methyltransferase